MPSLSLGIRIPAHRVRPNPRKNPEPGGPGWFYIGPPGEVDGPPGPDPTTYRVRVGSGFTGRVLKSSDNHMANSNICAFKPGPERNGYKYFQNSQKSQQ